MGKAKPLYGQSNYDLALQGYGSLDRAVQLCRDNRVGDLNKPNSSDYLINDDLIINRKYAGYQYSTIYSTLYLDVDTIAFSNACLAAGVELTYDQKLVLNRLILDLKGVYNPLYVTKYLWDRFLALYPFIGGVSATHKFNLKNPIDSDLAYRLVFTGSPTHSTTGVKFNGTNQYADTKLTFGTLNRYNYHMSHYSRTNVASVTQHDMGIYGNGGGGVTTAMNIMHGYTDVGVTYVLIGSSFYASIPNAAATGSSMGFGFQSRSSSDNAILMKDGVLLYRKAVSVASEITSAFNPYSIYIGAINNLGTAGLFSTRECCFASVGYRMDVSEGKCFNDAVQNFNNCLNRAINQ